MATESSAVFLTVSVARELDGRWLASIPELPGVHAYGDDAENAVRKVKALALFELADRLEHGEPVPGTDQAPDRFEFVAA